MKTTPPRSDAFHLKALPRWSKNRPCPAERTQEHLEVRPRFTINGADAFSSAVCGCACANRPRGPHSAHQARLTGTIKE